MSAPILTANRSYYDPSAQFTPADGSDQAIPPTASSATPSLARAVTTAPVLIVGDAGAQQLVKQFDAAREPPQCSVEGKAAALSCAKAGITAAGGLVISTTGLGVAVGIAATFAESISCGKDLRAYYDCETQ